MVDDYILEQDVLDVHELPGVQRAVHGVTQRLVRVDASAGAEAKGGGRVVVLGGRDIVIDKDSELEGHTVDVTWWR